MEAMALKSVPVRRATWKKLKAYKARGATYDEVINELMKGVPAEVVAERIIREHEERMRTREGRPWREALDG